MLTQCPECKTVFHLTPEQLKAARGRVRCGQCQTLFDALDHLVDAPRTDDGPSTTPASTDIPGSLHEDETLPDEEATDLLPYEAAAPLADAGGIEPAGQEPSFHAGQNPHPPRTGEGETPAVDSSAGEAEPRQVTAAPEVESVAFAEPAPRFIEPSAQDRLEAPETSEAKPLDEDVSSPAPTGKSEAGDSSSSRPPPTPHDPQKMIRLGERLEKASERIVIPGEPVRRQGDNVRSRDPAPEISAERSSQALKMEELGEYIETEAVTEIIVNENELEHGAVTANEAENAQPEAQFDTLSETDIETLLTPDASPAEEDEASPEPVKPADEAIEEATAPMPMPAVEEAESEPLAETAAKPPVEPETPAQEALQEPELPLQLQAAPRGRLLPVLGWGLGSLLLVALLAGQYGYWQRNMLAHSPQWRPWLEQLCQMTGCTLPLQRAPEQVEMRDHTVQSHPRQSGALLITATLVNQAPFPQPYPRVEVVMRDISQRAVAERSFLPREYLAGGIDEVFQPNTEAHLMLEVVDPGAEAVGFEFRFH